MPTYEYACAACGHEWEAVQRITDEPLTTCPSCARREANRLISRGAGFILKGGGWYSDLYASPKEAAKPKDAENTQVSPASPDAKGETSTQAGTTTETATKSASAEAPGSAAAA